METVKADLLTYGTGALFINKDGEARHIPLTDMYKSKAKMSDKNNMRYQFEITGAGGIYTGRVDADDPTVSEMWKVWQAAYAAGAADPYKALETAREALILMDKAWVELIPNIKNGVVQDYELVLAKAPIACTAALRQIDEVLK